MSYTVATPGGARPRPGTVSAAVNLLYAAAVLILASAGVSLYAFLALDTTAAIETPGVDAQSLENMTTIVAIASMAIYVVVAVAFVVLGVLVGKGRNPARIVTWTLGGIGAICCGCGLLGNAFSSAMVSNLEGVDQNEINRLNAEVPGWLTATGIGLDSLILLCLLGAIILLLLPPSNDFFRKEQELWVPPTYPGGQLPPPPPQQ